MSKKLSRKKIAQIKELILTKNYSEIAEIVGCSVGTIGLYTKKFGLESKRYKGHYKTLGEFVSKYYATHTISEIAKMVGCAPSTVFSYAQSHNIRRTDEQSKAIEQKRVNNVTQANRKIAEGDKRRMKFGIEPRTKWFYTLAPKRTLAATYRLHRKFGYEYTDDPYTMSRNGHTIKTQRKDCGEEYYSRVYGLNFVD